MERDFRLRAGNSRPGETPLSILALPFTHKLELDKQ